MKAIKAVMAAAVLAAVLHAPARAEIVFGLAVGLTGQIASIGDQARLGAETAIAAINAKGGVLGQKLRLEIADDACDPKQAVTVANQLVQKKVALVVGHLCSGASIAASDVYAEEGLIMLTGSATSPPLTERGLKNVFRACGRDDQQGTVAGRFLAERFKGKKIAIVHDKQAYGKGLADEALKALHAAGGKETYVGSVNPGERDFSALISRMKDAGIDVVYYGGYYQELGLMVRQSRQQAFAAQFIGGEGLAASEFWSITGEAGNGTLFTFTPDAKKNPAAQGALAAFRQRGVEPDNFGFYYHAAVQVAAQAVQAAGTTKFDDVLKTLRSHTFDTVVGSLRFDAKGDLIAPGFVFYEWRDGSFAEAKL